MTEREREVQHEPQVLEGQDDIPRQPAPPLDPYTPEPGPGPGEGRAFRWLRWAWLPIVVAFVAYLLYALLD